MIDFENNRKAGPSDKSFGCKMTYSEYRTQFNSVKEFKRAFGKLTEAEVRLLIASDNTPTFAKAAMMDAWKMIAEEVKA